MNCDQWVDLKINIIDNGSNYNYKVTIITSLEQFQNMVDCDWSLRWVLMTLEVLLLLLLLLLILLEVLLSEISQGYLLDISYLEVDLDDDFKLSPASLRHLIRWLRHRPISVGITVVQLEVHFLHVGRHVLVMRIEIRKMFPPTENPPHSCTA